MKSNNAIKQYLRGAAYLLAIYWIGLTAPATVLAASWTKVTNYFPGSPGVMLQLTDGTIMVQQNSGDLADWKRLTPSPSGSYVDGTWTTIQPMGTPRLYFASQVLQDGRVWVLGGEYSGPNLEANWVNTAEIYNPVTDTWSPVAPFPEEHFGDVPTMVLPNGTILAGSLIASTAYIYNPATDLWSAAASKNVSYDDSSDEESWVLLSNGHVLTYDIFKTVFENNGSGYAESYDPFANSWSRISPVDGTALGQLPVLSSFALGFELGPALRLQDGRVLVIGANENTALYTPGNNTWARGPTISGSLNGNPAAFGADDAPAAILPNGHVIFAADAGPSRVASSGTTALGSDTITGIPSTALFQVGWHVIQSDNNSDVIQNFTDIVSVDSPHQVTITAPALKTAANEGLIFGGTFSNPVELFDFNPAGAGGAGTISQLATAIPTDANLAYLPAFTTRMLVLPTGQLLFGSSSSQLYIYTPDGGPNPALRPVINKIAYTSPGVFTLAGKQLNGQSAGAAYGDDVQSDSNYPILRLVNSTRVYYCRTTNWSQVAVGMSTALQTVNFTLNHAMPPGRYAAIVSGAGISSFPVAVSITQAEVDAK